MAGKDSDQENKNKTNSEENENDTDDPSRRNFIKNTGMVVGGVAGGSILGGLLTNQYQTSPATSPEDAKSAQTPMEARMFFTRYEDFVVLEQATERIFPKDDNGPGAIELGVPYFIDKQLAGPWGLNAKDYRQGAFPISRPTTDQSKQTRGDLFINGIRKMNQLSNERFDTSFDEAEENQQIEILHDFETGEANMKGVASNDFFMLFVQTTIDGVYSDPLYGGNKNMDGWKMKEFPGAKPSYADIIGDDEFVKIDPISLTDYQEK